MTCAAVVWELSLRMARRRHLLVVLPVTVPAVCLHVRVLAVDMAFFTSYYGMFSHQRKSRRGMVERRRLPGVGRMARRTIMRELA